MSDNGCDVQFGKSVKGLYWRLQESCERTIRTFCQKLAINEILAKIIYNRGIETVEEASSFLDPKIKNLILDPFVLKDMDKAVDRVIAAINTKEKICIFGDYDVDGATSSALLKRFFKSIGIYTSVYIPNRIHEGYGPSIEAFNKLKRSGSKLVITVDCGTVSFEPIKHARKIGLDIIVIDHHLTSDELPQAVAVVNPNRTDELYSFKAMAAVGVSFMFIVALRARLRQRNWFATNSIDEPNLINLLDLVALGTVCDVMVLKGINRAFVAQGLKVMSQRSNIGIAALTDQTKIDTNLKAHHLGYVLGPRINAGGRVGEGILGSTLLSTYSTQKANRIASHLEQLNNERKAIELTAYTEAVDQVESAKLYDNSIILVKSSSWHVGILGILASKLKEKYSKPAAVVLINNEYAKGSARSIHGIDLGTALADAKAKNLLVEGGGHMMAGGFTLETSKIDAFYSYIQDRFSCNNEPFLRAKELVIDHIIDVTSITNDLMDTINLAAPFGAGNPVPKFALKDVKVVQANIVGGEHIMLIVADKLNTKKTQKCMLYRGLNTNIGQFLLKCINKNINLAGTLQANNFANYKADFIIEDASITEQV